MHTEALARSHSNDGEMEREQTHDLCHIPSLLTGSWFAWPGRPLVRPTGRHQGRTAGLNAETGEGQVLLQPVALFTQDASQPC